MTAPARRRRLRSPAVDVVRDFVFARVSWAARVIHRFSTWGAGAGLVAGGLMLVAVLPLLPRLGPWWPLAALGLALVLVAAPLRIMWHGRRIRHAYGDDRHVMSVLEGSPAALRDIYAALGDLGGGEARGLRRVPAAWRSLLAVRRAVVRSPARESLDTLVTPLRPQAIALSTAAMWVTLAVLVLVVPVVVVATLVALLT
jgi:hypothetical protein